MLIWLEEVTKHSHLKKIRWSVLYVNEMQVPLGLDVKAGTKLNKGKIYISKTSPACVVKAYLSQFQRDFIVFLRSRAAELVAGGRMVLSFMGRSSPDAAAEVGTHQWELLAQALMSMAIEVRKVVIPFSKTSNIIQLICIYIWTMAEEAGSNYRGGYRQMLNIIIYQLIYKSKYCPSG